MTITSTQGYSGFEDPSYWRKKAKAQVSAAKGKGNRREWENMVLETEKAMKQRRFEELTAQIENTEDKIAKGESHLRAALDSLRKQRASIVL